MENPPVSDTTINADVVRISDDEFRRIYTRAFESWADTYHTVVNDDAPRNDYVSIDDIFKQQPSFPQDLKLQHSGHKYGALDATGLSTWTSRTAHCSQGLPTFQVPVRMEVASGKEPLSVRVSTHREVSHQPNVGTTSKAESHNYLGVLVAAWAYIFSARWTELMPGQCSLQYTTNQAPLFDNHSRDRHTQSLGMVLDIGTADSVEVRWWTAILARGQGWQASMSFDDDPFRSPWSINFQADHPYFVSQSRNVSSGHVGDHFPPSFSVACDFLAKFCSYHHIIDESHAALAAVVVMPALKTSNKVLLETFDYVSLKQRLPGIRLYSLGTSSDASTRQYLDRLLTLSCNTKGIRPLLLSVFFDPQVECSAVTPWLEGAMAAIDKLANGDPHTLGCMLMERNKEVAILWLGCTVLGMQRKVMTGMKLGHIPLDLNAAAWSGTVQSFLQEPVNDPPTTQGRISRADECRLLYLSQTEDHKRLLLCPWKPFGVTPLSDAEVEVRLHEGCRKHALQYQSFSWNCTNDEGEDYELLDKPEGYTYTQYPKGSDPHHRSTSRMSCGERDRHRDFISEACTGMTFRWLRPDGYPPFEKEIWDHEWFDIGEADDDEEEEEGSDDDNDSQKVARSHQRVQLWIDQVEPPDMSENT